MPFVANLRMEWPHKSFPWSAKPREPLREFRLRHPWLFWLGTLLGWVAALHAPSWWGGVMWTVHANDPDTVAMYDLVLTPAQSAALTWAPSFSAAVALAGLFVWIVSTAYSGVPNWGKTAMVLIGLPAMLAGLLVLLLALTRPVW